MCVGSARSELEAETCAHGSHSPESVLINAMEKREAKLGPLGCCVQSGLSGLLREKGIDLIKLRLQVPRGYCELGSRPLPIKGI